MSTSSVEKRNEINRAVLLLKAARTNSGWLRVACAEDILDMVKNKILTPEDIGMTPKKLDDLAARGRYKWRRILYGKRPKDETNLQFHRR